jgi:hypothetical protein
VKRALLIVLALAACHRHEAPPAAKASAPAPLAHATQADLASELDLAQRTGTWSEVRQRWQGQAVHWTVVRYRSLCSSADACFVAPFAIQRPAKHGWMPQLELSPAEFAKLDRQCGAAAQCQVTFEGTLAEITASAEQPTALRFSNVRVL